MPIITGTTAPTFSMGGSTFTGLAAPSRGAKETAVWRLRVGPGTPHLPHTFDHEEVLVATAGRAVASLDGVEQEVTAGDAIIVPAGAVHSLANPFDEPFEAVVALPVGALARFGDGEPFVPPAAV